MTPLTHRTNKRSRKTNSARRRTRAKLSLEAFEPRAMMAFGGEFALGSEFTGNTEVATASSADGTSVAVWVAPGTGGDTDILGQLYNADGTERGGIFGVSTGPGRDSEPAVAMDADGDFVVSFTRAHNFGFLNLDTDRDVRARRFNSSGAALGGSVGVSLSDSEEAFDSDVAMDSNGDFVVAYTAETTKTRQASFLGIPFTESFTDRDVRARLFNSNGAADGGTFGVDTGATLFEQDASVAMADNGRFVVAYENGNDIQLRQFTAGGTLRRTLTLASSSRVESNPDVAVDSAGNAVVAWQDATNGADIKARRVSDGGAMSPVLVIRSTSDFEIKPSVALSRDGNEYIVAYNREVRGGSLVADHVDATRVIRSGGTDAVEGHQSLGQGMDGPSISVDGADRFFVGYNDIFDAQVLGRWGQMGGSAPTDKIAHGFEIDLVFEGLTAAQRAIFRQAADRWEEVIVGDLPNATVNGVSVDDVRIEASAVDIDGVSGVLGQAGPRELRNGSSLPIRGEMRFDTADIANMESDGRLLNVILHEMGHVLGIGTLWDNLGLIQGEGTGNPRYIGVNGVAGFNASRGFVGFISPVTSVPVEGNGGPGTADAHWDEETLGNELMTGFVEPADTAMPLSRITVGSLDDMGYDVNYAAADPFGSIPVLTPRIAPQRIGELPGLRADDAAGDSPNAKEVKGRLLGLAQEVKQCGSVHAAFDAVFAQYA
jgi:hypothetical protein